MQYDIKDINLAPEGKQRIECRNQRGVVIESRQHLMRSRSAR